jgi:hypothetical protein
MADERLKPAKACERKALEARARAETIKDWDARGTMLLIAPMWEALARHGHVRKPGVTGPPTCSSSAGLMTGNGSAKHGANRNASARIRISLCRHVYAAAGCGSLR